jgi:hypothetical protein
MTRADYQKDYRQSYKAHAKRVNLTFALPEHRALARSAKAQGMPVAAYVKRLALDAQAGRQDAPAELQAQLDELDRLIRTIANNVNQMARHSHRIGHVLDEQEVFLHIHALQVGLKDAIARAAAAATPAAEDGGEDSDGQPG